MELELEITIDNISNIKKNRMKKGYVALFHSHHCGHCISFMPTWKKLIKSLSNQYQFHELEQEGMQKMKNDYNITFNKVKYFPYICVYSPDKKEHIEYTERDRSIEALTKFIKSNLNLFQPSTLTSENIISKLENAKKNNFILLVHWNKCPYCIKFMPLWNKLKENYNDRIQFFELEKTEYDKINGNIEFLDKYVTGYPSIILYNNDNQNYEKFQEERNIYNLSKFIEKNI